MTSHTHAAEHTASAQSPVVTDSAQLINSSGSAQAVGKRNVPPHYLVSELAARWAVSPASIYRMIDAQDLSHIKIRGAIRIPYQVVLDYEAKQLAASAIEPEVVQ